MASSESLAVLIFGDGLGEAPEYLRDGYARVAVPDDEIAEQLDAERFAIGGAALSDAIGVQEYPVTGFQLLGVDRPGHRRCAAASRSCRAWWPALPVRAAAAAGGRVP